MRTKTFVGLLSGIAFVLSLNINPSAYPASSADISGTWTLTQTNPTNGQNESFDLAIKVARENLTITGKHPELGDMDGKGTLKGNDIKMNINTAGGALVFAFTGKVASNKMSGTREITAGQSSVTPSGQGQAAGSSSTGGQGGQPPQGSAPSNAPPQGAVPMSDYDKISKAWTAVKK